jgi:isopenicillin N synthase-like dioxygenase
LALPEAKWLVGWSCGKEKLKDGQYDTLKGSYYVNCSPTFADTMVQADLSEKYPSFPEYTASNIWPSESLLPGFSKAFVDLCTLIIEVATLVARACDQYAEAKIEGYKKGYLEHIVKTSHVTKGRLLHYFPPPKEAYGIENSDDDDWCATHKDHGCLTGLTSAMFVDEAANPPKLDDQFIPIPELGSAPDPRAGLYIHSRSGQVVKVGVPRDCLAFQTGEALELITQGKFKAVPHFVRGAALGKGGKIARNTLAVFTQPNLWEMVDDRRDFAAFAREIVEKNH